MGAAKVVRMRRVIEGEEIRLVDSKGRVRIRLTVNDDVPSLALLDERGVERISANLEEPDRALIVMCNAKGRMLAALAANQRGGSFALRDDASGACVVQAAQGGSATMSMEAEQGQGRLLARVQKGEEAIELTDAEGKTVWSAPHKPRRKARKESNGKRK